MLTRHSIRIPILCNCAGHEFAACHAVCHAVCRAVLLSREARLGLAAGSDGGAAGLSGQHQPRLGSLSLEGHSNLRQDNSCGVMNGSHFCRDAYGVELRCCWCAVLLMSAGCC